MTPRKEDFEVIIEDDVEQQMQRDPVSRQLSQKKRQVEKDALIEESTEIVKKKLGLEPKKKKGFGDL